MALYNDNMTLINELCNVIMTDRPSDMIISFDNGEYFVTYNNDEYFTVNCYGKEAFNMNACSFCIISPECNCKIISSKLQHNLDLLWVLTSFLSSLMKQK